MRTIEVKLYQFDELSRNAQTNAIEWFKSLRDGSELDFSLEDAATIAAILGIELDTRDIKLHGGGTRQEPMIHYRLGYSQGDGAAFTGTYRYKAGCMAAIKAHAPEDDRLHRIACALYEAQKPHAYKITALCSDTGRGGSPYQGVDVAWDLYREGHCGPAEKAITDALRSFADWIYQQVRTEDEYQCEDAQVAESIRANEYEFTEDGKRA